MQTHYDIENDTHNTINLIYQDENYVASSLNAAWATVVPDAVVLGSHQALSGIKTSRER
jgi:hypothetical protein